MSRQYCATSRYDNHSSLTESNNQNQKRLSILIDRIAMQANEDCRIVSLLSTIE